MESTMIHAAYRAAIRYLLQDALNEAMAEVARCSGYSERGVDLRLSLAEAKSRAFALRKLMADIVAAESNETARKGFQPPPGHNSEEG